MRKGVVIALVVAAGAAAVPFLLPMAMRARADNPIWHGMREAEEHGCFNCHSAPNNRELPNPGSTAETVPSFAGGNAMMYVDRPEEIQEWIRDGVTKARAADPKRREESKAQLIHMPAFGGTLDADEIDALAAYVLAVDDYFSPSDDPARRGEEIVRQQCMSCHNVGGAGGLPNPGSPFGYVPGFFGPDFHDLVKNEAEMREWIATGTSKRVAAAPFAQWFWKRQKIAMPAFGDHLSREDVDAIVAYIEWLGKSAGGTRLPATDPGNGAGG
jgi:mono/diheme cytochrome c family protein